MSWKKEIVLTSSKLNESQKYINIKSYGTIIKAEAGVLYNISIDNIILTPNNATFIKHGNKVTIKDINGDDVVVLDYGNDAPPLQMHVSDGWCSLDPVDSAGSATASSLSSAASSSVPAAESSVSISAEPTAADASHKAATGSEFSLSSKILAGLALAGGGVGVALASGGGGGSDSSTPSPTPATATLSGSFMAGPVVSGGALLATAYDAAGNVLGTTTIDSDGKFHFTINKDYKGNILIQVTDNSPSQPDYYDEASGKAVNLATSLRAVITVDGATDVTVNVTPLTELAARQLNISTHTTSSIDSSKISALNTTIAKLFGLGSVDVTTLTPEAIINADGTINASATPYGKVLALLSGVGNGDLDSSIKFLEANIVQTNGTVTWKADALVAIEQALANAAVLVAQTTGAAASELLKVLDGNELAPPSAPIASLHQDTGASASDAVTSKGDIDVSGLLTGGSWEYSTDGGAWTKGSGSAVAIAGLQDGAHSVLVRQVDATGKISVPTVVKFTLDTVAAAPTLSLASDTGSSGTDNITSNGVVNVSGLENGATWKYSLDGGKTWTAGTGTSIAASAFTGDKEYTVQIQQTDTAGNVSSAGSLTFTLDTAKPSFSAVRTSWGDVLDSAEASVDGTVNIATSGLEDGQSVRLQLNGHDYSATVKSNSATISIPKADLAGLTNGATYNLIANTSDKAGNTADSYTGSFTVDLGTPSIKVNAVTADNVINAKEAGETVAVTGTTDNCKPGDVVTLTVNGKDFVGNVLADKSFSIDVSGSDLAADSDHVVEANVVTTVGGASKTATADHSYAIDAKAPTVSSIAMSDTALKIGETATVTVTFSEKVTGFDKSDVTVENGSIGDFSTTDGGLTWTATFTPTANIEDASNVVTVASSYTDLAGNAGSGATSGNYAIDAKAPTISSIAMSDTALKIGETATVTITFSEKVTGFDKSDVTVENGSIGDFSTTDGGLTWTATFTPTANIEDASNVVTVANNSYTDLAGNVGTGATSGNYAIDAKAPTVSSIAMSDTALKIGETATVTVTFSEKVTGFDKSDVTVENGSIGDFSTTDGGTTWTATFTPTANIEDASNVVTVANNSYTDLAGNAGTGATSGNYAIDAKAPTVSSIAMSDTALKIGETATVTVTFSEKVTGFDKSDVTVENGSIGDFSTTDGGTTWTATFTPTANIEDASNVVTVANNSYTDLAGNAGSSATSGNYAIDAKAPTVSSIAMSDTALKIGETATVTVTFSEKVTGFDKSDVTVENGSIGDFSTTDGGLTWTATFTPTANIEDASNVVTVANNSYTDLAGNAGSGATSGNYAIDAKAPTVSSIAMSDTALKIGETATVTVTFSEKVTGFDKSDVTVENGSIGDFTTTDGGLTWTATFTPTANIEDASNVVTVASSYTDLAGNAGSGATSGNYAIDAKAPTISSIAMSDTALKIGETATVTVTFSEKVTGFDKSDVTVENGSIGDFSTTDGGLTWTATFTPTANIEDASNVDHGGEQQLHRPGRQRRKQCNQRQLRHRRQGPDRHPGQHGHIAQYRQRNSCKQRNRHGLSGQRQRECNHAGGHHRRGRPILEQCEHCQCKHRDFPEPVRTCRWQLLSLHH